MKEMIWTVGQVLSWTTQKFKDLDLTTPSLDAQLLITHALGWPNRIQLFTHADRPLNSSERSQIKDLVKRRINGEPVAYIIGKKYWLDLNLKVNSSVLIPRPETETLVDQLVDEIKRLNHPPQLIYDFCSGSGCISAALGKAFPSSKVIGVDICPDAIDIAIQNSLENNAKNVEFLCADVLSSATHLFLLEQFGSADVLVSNPPYISMSNWNNLDIEVKEFEPQKALIGGETGIEFSRTMLQKIIERGTLSSEGGLLFLECDVNQPRVLASDLQKNLCNLCDIEHQNKLAILKDNTPYCFKDLEQKERFLGFRWNS